METTGSYLLMRAWVAWLGKPLRPTVVLAEGKRNLEWTAEEVSINADIGAVICLLSFLFSVSSRKGGPRILEELFLKLKPRSNLRIQGRRGA